MNDPSRFRDFLIPNTQNNLQSASYSHERGDYERAEKNLDAAEKGIKDCREQLKRDRNSDNGQRDR